ncbi:hypothetical protein B0H13DRAFT_2325193 [Mycena leptocephala]|nr:hypothetical protein B0H13DRAFT_2325193 [Mycena leptocephala]
MTTYYSDIQNIHLLNAMHDRVLKTFSMTLRLYQNLFSLYITGLTIDAAFRETLLSLPSLQDLHLSHTIIRSHPQEAEGAVEIVSPDLLRSLNLDLHDGIPLINGLGARQLHHLVHLSIRFTRDLETLFRFFQQSPRLQALEIRLLNRKSTLPAVHPNTLPLLRTLSGPPKLLRLLGPNRPIERVTILNDIGSAMDLPELARLCMDISRSSVQIYALTLPCTYSTLDFLNTIPALFPHIRESTVGIADSTGIVCRLRRPLRNSTPGDDTQSPVLCDAAAFDDLPTDDISSDDAEEPPIIVITKGSKTSSAQEKPYLWTYAIDRILDWLFIEALSLPPHIVIFHLVAPWLETELPLQKQHLALVALSGQCPHLREVEFGLKSSTWKRKGDLWRSPGKSCVRVLS